MSNEPEPGAVPADVEGLARHRFYALGLKHWDAFWLGWCESAALRGRVVPHKEGCDGGEFTCICSYATGRVVGGKDVAGLLRAAKCPDENCDGKGVTWYAQLDGGGDPEQVQAQCQWCDERATALALLERAAPPTCTCSNSPAGREGADECPVHAAPLHDLAVGQRSSPTQCEVPRSSPPSLPLTGGKQ
jgi:hypothetical protein